MIDVLRHLPDLENVILRHAGNHPVVVLVPGKVGDLARVAAVDEEQLRGAVFRVLRRLLLADSANETSKKREYSCQLRSS